MDITCSQPISLADSYIGSHKYVGSAKHQLTDYHDQQSVQYHSERSESTVSVEVNKVQQTSLSLCNSKLTLKKISQTDHREFIQRRPAGRQSYSLLHLLGEENLSEIQDVSDSEEARSHGKSIKQLKTGKGSKILFECLDDLDSSIANHVLEENGLVTDRVEAYGDLEVAETSCVPNSSAVSSDNESCEDTVDGRRTLYPGGMDSPKNGDFSLNDCCSTPEPDYDEEPSAGKLVQNLSGVPMEHLHKQIQVEKTCQLTAETVDNEELSKRFVRRGAKKIKSKESIEPEKEDKRLPGEDVKAVLRAGYQMCSEQPCPDQPAFPKKATSPSSAECVMGNQATSSMLSPLSSSTVRQLPTENRAVRHRYGKQLFTVLKVIYCNKEVSDL